VCFGGYILNIDPKRWRLAAPLLAVLREPGSRRMLLVAFLFSFGAVIGKKGILHSSPLFFTMGFFLLLNLTLSAAFLATGRVRWALMTDRPRAGMTAGGLLYLHALCHGFAISMAPAAYMIAIKRLSVLFSVVYGGLFFRETQMALRLSGAGIMVAGAVLITLTG
jgi:drug/metabolite transporter (DMT)-like permease